MKRNNRLYGMSALIWSVLTTAGSAAMVLASPLRNNDIYDIQGGMRAISEQPGLVIGGQLVFAWAGAALVLLVLAFYAQLPDAYRSFTLQAATAFGLISAALFLFYGLAGAFSSFDLRYLQRNRSAVEVQAAYLPVTLVMNRALAAAISISGLWLVPANWAALHSRFLPPSLAYLGIGAGVPAMFGWVLPGGGFSLLSLLMGVIWGLFIGMHWLRVERRIEAAA